MTPAYLARLLLLASASFFLLQMLAQALVAWIAQAAVRRAETLPPRRAARLLLTLRLLPAAFASVAVLALGVPSYLRFEPRAGEEEVGYACLAAAILGASLWGFGIYRTLASLIQSARFVRRCHGRESRIEGERVWIVEQRAGLALAGILHPRLLISRHAMAELSRDQLAAALRHEHAHRASRDNLKRLLILLSPAIFPRLRLLEREWAKQAEWAADDRAAEGDSGHPVALASALVRVARLQSAAGMPLLVTSLVEANEDLTLRVERLLHAAPASESSLRGMMLALFGVTLPIAAIAINSGALRIVHTLLEKLLN